MLNLIDIKGSRKWNRINKNKRKEENEQEKEEENEQVNKISYSVVRIYELINFKINNKSNLLTNS